MKSPFSRKFWRRVKSQVQKLDEDIPSKKPKQMKPAYIKAQATSDRAWAAARNRFDEIIAISDMPFDMDDPVQACSKFCLCLVAGEIALRRAIILQEEVDNDKL